MLCPVVHNSRGNTTPGLRAWEGVGNLETEKLSDKKSDFKSRDTESQRQTWSKAAEGKK